MISPLIAKEGRPYFDSLARHISHAATKCGNSSNIGIGSSHTHADSQLFEKLEKELSGRLPRAIQKGLYGGNFLAFLKRSLPQG